MNWCHVKELTTSVKQAVAEAFENNAIENGHLTADRIKVMFDNYHEKVVEAIDERMNKITMFQPRQEEVTGPNDFEFADGMIEEGGSNCNSNNTVPHRLYSYSGKFWHVPKQFCFPKDAKLLTGWLLWVSGQDGYREKTGSGTRLAPIRPFCLLTRKFLPKALRTSFSLHWQPIYKLMESAPDININASPHDSFNVGYDYLKSRVSYVFMNPKSKPETWLVSYWSLKVQRSSIVKYGTEEDKLQLSTPTFCNKAKKQKNRMSSDGRQLKRIRKKKWQQHLI